RERTHLLFECADARLSSRSRGIRGGRFFLGTNRNRKTKDSNQNDKLFHGTNPHETWEKGLTGFSRRPSANQVKRLGGREAKARATAQQKQRRQWSRLRETWRPRPARRCSRRVKRSRNQQPSRADKGANPKGQRSGRRRNGTARPGS